MISNWEYSGESDRTRSRFRTAGAIFRQIALHQKRVPAVFDSGKSPEKLADNSMAVLSVHENSDFSLSVQPTDVGVMRPSPVRAAGFPRVNEPLLVLAALRRRLPGLHRRAAVAAALARRARLRRSCSRSALLLPHGFGVRALVALRLGHEDGQLSRDDRAVSRLQVDDHAASAHRPVLVRHPGK